MRVCKITISSYRQDKAQVIDDIKTPLGWSEQKESMQKASCNFKKEMQDIVKISQPSELCRDNAHAVHGWLSDLHR